MVRIKLLLVVWAVAFSAVLIPAQSAIANDGSCAVELVSAGLCAAPEATGAFNNGGVDLSAGYESGTGGGDQNDGDGGGEVVVDGGSAANDSFLNPVVRDNFTINCTPGTPCDPNVVVQISDLVNFKPTTPTQVMEPNGWMVIGLPANFVATASVHTLSGSLLGFPADVRFTPVGYHWDYGDGGIGSSRAGGSTWAAQNLREFSDTATSHIYRASGSYTIALSVDYTAEYRFAGQAWRGIRGTLAVPANPLIAVAGSARTVLVDRECTRNPTGPGC